MSLDVTPACPRHSLHVAPPESSAQQTTCFQGKHFEWITSNNAQPAPEGFICAKEKKKKTLSLAFFFFHGTKHTTGSTRQDFDFSTQYQTPPCLCVRPSTSLHGSFRAPDPFVFCTFSPKHWSKVED